MVQEETEEAEKLRASPRQSSHENFMSLDWNTEDGFNEKIGFSFSGDSTRTGSQGRAQSSHTYQTRSRESRQRGHWSSLTLIGLDRAKWDEMTRWGKTERESVMRTCSKLLKELTGDAPNYNLPTSPCGQQNSRRLHDNIYVHFLLPRPAPLHTTQNPTLTLPEQGAN